MTKVHVVAEKDFLTSISVSSRPIPALAELIWNGFDANSNKVSVFVTKNSMDGIETISIRDNGYGINHEKIERLFGSLGGSWKKSEAKQNGRALHGKNGKGRFKAFSLGEQIEWQTTFEKDGKIYSYKIKGHANSIEDFEVSEVVELDQNKPTGTTVVVCNLLKNFHSLQNGTVEIELAKIFAAYLTEYPSVQLDFDGEEINPKEVQKSKVDYQLRDVLLSGGESVKVEVSIVEWKISVDRVLHLCDANGVALHEVSIGTKVRAPGYNFTAYVKSDFFRELDKSNSLCLSDMNEDAQRIIAAATNQIKKHFRERLSEEQSAVVETWKKDKIYPYEDAGDIGPVELAERQVFDILAVNVQSYLPSFEDADFKSKKFTFLLLAQAIHQNPESVQLIISEVLGLKKEAQDDLADLLKETSLSSIISSAKTVANRLDFLKGLDFLLFEKENKKALLERDQLHKILENEAWVFNENFTLSGSELTLEDVLQKHLSLLGERKEVGGIVDVGDGKRGRVDLMFHKAVQPKDGEFEFLIVELKRPSKKIDSEVLAQIKSYAFAVANDERFRNIKICWTFIAVSNDFNEQARREASQRDKPKGVVHDDAELNLTVWAKTWSEIINDAKSKLNFVNKHLAYEANSNSSKEYLQRTHNKFIPVAHQLKSKD